MKRTYNRLASLLLLVAMFAMSNVAKAQFVLSDGWVFANVYPEPDSEVESITKLEFQLPAYDFVNSGTDAYIVNMNTEEIAATVRIDSYKWDGTCEGRLSNPITKLGRYKLVIEGSSLSLANGDFGGVFMCGEMSYEWAIPYKPKDGWTFTSVTPAEGEVESISSIILTLPAGVTSTMNGYTNQAEIEGPDGEFRQVSINDMNDGTCVVDLSSNPITAPGTYTLRVEDGTLYFGNADAAGAVLYNNAGQTFTWTIPAPKCAAPRILVSNGNLKFECDTPGAKFYSYVTLVGDGGSAAGTAAIEGSEVCLAPVYRVSVYAEAEGYEKSDIVEEEIAIKTPPATTAGDVNGDGVVNMQDAVDLIDIYLGNGGE